MKQRITKFRAWDGKAMWKVYEYHFARPQESSCVVGQREEVDKDGNTVWLKSPMLTLREATLMQFTGLKDKNSKEIYEGDVVKWNKQGKDWIVVWGDGMWCIELIEETVAPVPLLESIPSTRSKHAEIIGNIHENKDLL